MGVFLDGLGMCCGEWEGVVAWAIGLVIIWIFLAGYSRMAIYYTHDGQRSLSFFFFFFFSFSRSPHCVSVSVSVSVY